MAQAATTQDRTRPAAKRQESVLAEDPSTNLGQWARWAPMVCTGVLAVGTSLASPWILWILAVTAAAGTILPNHPFEYLYNHGLRHLTGTAPLPPNTPQRKIACGIVAVLLIGTGFAFFAEATTLGYVMGVGSKLYIRVLKRPKASALAFRAVLSVLRSWEH